MNYINYFISKPGSIPSSERIEIKKRLFGVTNELTAQKFAFGFFLDSVVSSGETENLKKLKRYEYYAPSLSCEMVVSELKAFFETPEFMQLQPETQKQLKKAVDLLEKSQNLYYLVDDVRSSDPRKIFLVLTGLGSSLIGDQAVEGERLKEIVAAAAKQIDSLSIGEKAVFPAGNITHETLLSVEKIDEKRFEVRYYNTADYTHTKRKYLVDSTTLKGEAFWEAIYSGKFLKENMPLTKQLNEFETIEMKDRDLVARLRQKKNTCHVRSILAFVKDMVVERSTLPVEEAYFDWHRFKELFGELFLKNGRLPNVEMERICRQQQKKRASRNVKFKDFHNCVKEGKAEETLKAYDSFLKDFFHHRGLFPIISGNLLYDLNQGEKEFLQALEKEAIFPEELATYSEKVSNPWVKQTLAQAIERFSQRQKEFRKSLQEEIEEISTPYYLPFKTFKRSAFEKWNETNKMLQEKIPFKPIYLVEYRKSVDGFPIEITEVEQLLDFFEKSPERLHFLDQKPCCLAIFKQAIQWGMIERVDKIYQLLPQKEKEEILSVCKEKVSFASSNVPKTIDFIVAHPDSEIAKAVFAQLSFHLLDYDKLSEFLKVASAIANSDLGLFSELENAYIAWRAPPEVPEEEQVHILSLLRPLQANQETAFPGFVAWLHACLGQSFLKQEKIDLTKWAEQWKVPIWENYCGWVHLARLYREGDFEKVKTLAGKTSGSPYPLEVEFRFSEENVQEGLELLKMAYPPLFLSMLFHDLVKFACQNRSVEVLEQALKIYKNSSEDQLWEKFDYKELLFIVQFLAGRARGNHNKIISSLIKKIDSKERFDETNRLVTEMGLKPSAIEVFYGLSKYLNPTFQGVLVHALRQNECYRAVMNLTSEGGDYRRGESFSDYRKHFRTFIKEWELLTKNENFSDYQRVYKEFIQPIFKMHIYSRNSVIDILELLNHMALAENVRLPLAVLYREADEDKKEGKDERALKIFPDKEKLEAAYAVLHPRDKSASV